MRARQIATIKTSDIMLDLLRTENISVLLYWLVFDKKLFSKPGQCAVCRTKEATEKGLHEKLHNREDDIVEITSLRMLLEIFPGCCEL